jgi:hypothetical protein
VPVKSFVCFRNELFIKAFRAYSRLVAAHEKDCFSLWVEGKGDTPSAISHIEPHLFHVGVAGAFKRVDPGSAELWSKFFEKFSMSEELVLHVLRQGVKLRVEIFM